MLSLEEAERQVEKIKNGEVADYSFRAIREVYDRNLIAHLSNHILRQESKARHRICQLCGTAFERKRCNQRYCSPECVKISNKICSRVFRIKRKIRKI